MQVSYIVEVYTDRLFSASHRPGMGWPFAIPEKLSLAQPVFSWAWPCRLKMGPAGPSSA